MQTNRRSELTEAIRDAVRQFRESGVRFMNRNIVDAVIESNGPLFAELGQSLAREKLYDLTRRVMKSAAAMSESDAQLDLGLDVAGFEMPSMIAVPADPASPLSGDCEWVPVTEATIADLDANLLMLDFQIRADQSKRRNVLLLRQRVVALVGEDSAYTVGQAAAMARELQPA